MPFFENNDEITNENQIAKNIFPYSIKQQQKLIVGIDQEVNVKQFESK